jgi:hypothetical protein
LPERIGSGTLVASRATARGTERHDLAQQSGARYFTLAFLETLNKHSCTLAWNGSSSQTEASGRYLADIASLRTMGGDVVLSLGGWSADQGGTEIGDSCGDPQSIAAA